MKSRPGKSQGWEVNDIQLQTIPHSNLMTRGEESKCQDKSRNKFNTFETMSQQT